ncbi:MAG: AAA family ATPase [Bacteroidota bacterium]
MKFVMIFGPQAVGKMTVGQALEKVTNFKLLHNHGTLELLTPIFGYGNKSVRKLSNLFRQEIFKEAAKSDLEGLIFTYVWALNIKEDWDYVRDTCNIFRVEGGEVYLVELEAPLEQRIERNKHPNRLKHKPTKRDLARSEKDLRGSLKKYRLNSQEGEIKEKNYLKVNNADLSPDEVAQIIKDKFSFCKVKN